MLAALVVSPAVQAQYALSDSSEWEHLGAHRQQLLAFGFSGSPDNLVVWAMDTGIYRLSDTPDGDWQRLGIRPSGGGALMIGSSPDTLIAGDALYRSIDGGETFVQLSTLPNSDGERIDSDGAISRFSPDSPYPYRLVAGDWPNLQYSDDGGDTWTRPEASPTHGPKDVYAFTSGRVLSAGFYGAALSLDGARTFEAIPELYNPDQVSFNLRSMMVLPGFVTGQPGDSGEGRVLISGSEQGQAGTLLWSTDDEGDSWREVARYPTFCSPGFMMSPVSPEVGGEVGWAIGVDCEDTILATGDGGETWFPIGKVPIESGTGTSTQTVVVGPDGRLYAGTSRNGPAESWSWRTREPVADVVRVAVSSQEGPDALSRASLTVFPNPSRQLVTLALSGPPSESHQLVVVDSVGREVARTELVAGSSWRLDVSDWAPGVYHARAGEDRQLEAVSFTVVR
ncbi:MAG: hypothetical protein Rubg2KO_14100 [Rubricoccaceae bacterium]